MQTPPAVEEINWWNAATPPVAEGINWWDAAAPPSTTTRWKRVSLPMFEDAIWWIIFSMAEFQFFPGLFWHHTQMIRDHKYCPSDVWIPNPQRISVLSALWQSGQWHKVQKAFGHQLSGLPYSTCTKLAFNNKFQVENETKLIEAIQHFLQDQSKPVWTSLNHLDSESSSSESGVLFSSSSSRTASSPNVYIGTSTESENRFKYRTSIYQEI